MILNTEHFQFPPQHSFGPLASWICVHRMHRYAAFIAGIHGVITGSQFFRSKLSISSRSIAVMTAALNDLANLVPVVFEDEHLVIINKPSGMLSVAGRDRIPTHPRHVEWRMAIAQAAKSINYSPACIALLQQLPTAKVELSRNKKSFMKQVYRFTQDTSLQEEVWEAIHSTDASMHKTSLESLPPHRRSAVQILEVNRPHVKPVHRLDCETSGVMVVAKDQCTAAQLAAIFRTRQVSKIYTAIVDGIVSSSVTSIDLPLHGAYNERPKQRVDYELGKPSQTLVTVLRTFQIQSRDVTEVQLTPVTGRTHQLRLHMSSIGHAILGDTLYATEEVMRASNRLELHATRLQFKHPYTSQDIDITVPKLPPLFDNAYLISHDMIYGGYDGEKEERRDSDDRDRKRIKVDEESDNISELPSAIVS